MPKVHTQVAAKDYPESGIKKGDTYYSWSFRYGGKRKSKTYPTPAQLAQSGFKIAMYGIQDLIDGLALCNTPEELKDAVQSIISDLQEQHDEAENSLSNIPEHLQESHMLNERVEMLSNAISEFENVDLDYDTPENEEEESVDSVQEWLTEKVDELQSISLDF